MKIRNGRFCSQCGHRSESGAKFCTACGNEINTDKDGSDIKPEHRDANDEPSFNYQPRRRGSRIVIHKKPNRRKTVEFKDLHPSATWIFFIAYLKNTAVLLLLLLAGVIFSLWFVAAVAVYLLIHYIAAVVAYKHYRFEINSTSFRKQFGILQVKTVSIPFRRVQNVNVRRSLLDRALGLAHVDIETAGTGGVHESKVIGGSATKSEGHIPGVAPEEAKDIKDLMLIRSHRSGGV